jgi:hypothetical protein
MEAPRELTLRSAPPLFDANDPEDVFDFVQRVEPGTPVDAPSPSPIAAVSAFSTAKHQSSRVNAHSSRVRKRRHVYLLF